MRGTILSTLLEMVDTRTPPWCVHGVTSKPEKLPDDPALLRRFIKQLGPLVEKQGRDIERCNQTIEKLQRIQFGQKSEKLDPLQLELGFAADSAELGEAGPVVEAQSATPADAALNGDSSSESAQRT